MQKILFLFALTVVSLSCSKSDPEPVVVTTIEDEFVLIPWQDLNPDQSEFNLIIRSAELQNCADVALDATIEFENEAAVIQINGIELIEPCVEGESYAEAKLYLDAEPGTYPLMINLGTSISNHGEIIIEDDAFKVDVEVDTGIALLQDSLLRIEEGVSWGYVDDRLTGMDLNTELQNAIFQEINIVTSFREGNYGHFEVGDLNAIYINGSPNDVTGVLLDTRPPGTWQQLKELMISYEEKYPGLQYQFTRWDGLEIWN